MCQHREDDNVDQQCWSRLERSPYFSSRLSEGNKPVYDSCEECWSRRVWWSVEYTMYAGEVYEVVGVVTTA